MLVCLTANHRNADFGLLEQLSRSDATLGRDLVDGTVVVDGAVVLATCNRFEAYLDVDEPITGAEAVAAGAVADAVEKVTGVSATDFLAQVTVLAGADVPEHLFAVSAGLESVVVGEDEISGQVRRALESARAGGTTTSALERMFQSASATSREVRNTAMLGGHGRSLVRLSLELASSRIADWSSVAVLLIGSGSYARTSIQALRDRGVIDLALHSPSGRGAGLAARRGLPLVEQADFDDALAHADVIVTCTSAERYLGADRMAATARETGRLVIDLGMPRNVDPAVGTLHDVELLDLEMIRRHAPHLGFDADAIARDLVADAAGRFEDDRRSEQATDALIALRRHVLDLVDQEVDRATRAGAGEETERALRHLAGVLLHTPSIRAKELGGRGEGARFADAIAALYDLRSDAAPRPALRADAARTDSVYVVEQVVADDAHGLERGQAVGE